MTRTEAALTLAFKAHGTQVRKHDGSPYIIHPIMVAHMLTLEGVSEDVIVAALLHDVLEDTAVTKDKILAVGGEVVLHIVETVTEDMSLPWEVRKEAYVAQVTAATSDVWLVSVADKVHNAETLLDYIARVGDDAWKVFNRGKKQKLWFEEMLFTQLKNVWPHPLLDRYGELIEKLKAS